MAGSLSITTVEFDFKAFIPIINTICFVQSHKRESTKTIKKKKKRGQIVKNNKGIAPYQKRETNLKVCKAQMPLLNNTLLVSQTV